MLPLKGSHRSLPEYPNDAEGELMKLPLNRRTKTDLKALPVRSSDDDKLSKSSNHSLPSLQPMKGAQLIRCAGISKD